MPRDWKRQFEEDLPRMLADLEGMVRLESPSDDPARVSLLATWVRNRLRAGGVGAELRPCPPRGEAVLASIGPRDGATLLLGHLDTVWPVGTLATIPVRVPADRAFSPALFDIKRGVRVALPVV